MEAVTTDHFTCERFRCTMRKAVCIERQTELIRTMGAWHLKHLECQKCPQGESISNTKLGEKEIMDDPKKTPSAKKCSGCDETKPLDAFTKSKAGHLGRKSKCKVCEAARAHEYWLKKKMLRNARTAVEREKTGRITREKTNDQLKLILDLYGYEEVMEALEEQARINIRTPAGQALYYVVSALKRDSGNVNATTYPQS